MFYRLFALLLQQAEAVWRTVVKTGTGMIVSNDTTEGQPVDIQLQGWTEQNSTTGAQLINQKELEIGGLTGNNGSEFDATTRIRTGYIPVKAGVRYRLLGFSPYKIANSHIFKEDKTTRISGFADGDLIPEEGAYFRVSFQNSGGTDLTEDDLLVLANSAIFSEGLTSVPYEPYTGGQPSPSPEYQQSIENSGKYNSETGKYELEIELSGSQIWKNPEPKTLSGVTMTVDEDGWATLNGTAEAANNFELGNMALESGTYTMSIETEGEFPLISSEPISQIYSVAQTSGLSVSGATTSKKATGSIKSANDYRFRIHITKGFTYNNSKVRVMLNHGSDVIKWETYKEPQTVTVTSDRPITKWDRLVEQNGQIGWMYKTLKQTFDGTEKWNEYGSYEGFSVGIGISNPSSRIDGKCDMFKVIKRQENIDQKGLWLGVGNNNIYAVRMYEYATTSEDWKQWLKEHPFTLITESAEQEFIPLPSEEQGAIKALKTYYPTTVFSNDQEMFMQVEYQTKVPEQEV